jgi:serine/threonine-protein kinase
MNLETGSIVGDYQIIGVLGEGGMGKVFKVRNTISDRVEAMKVLLPDLAGEPELADRFLREIKVLASLDHPNIAALRTAVRFENQLLMIMEMVEGISLDQRLRQIGKLSVEEAVRCISQVLAALACAHGRGVIHRDIKPANMMLTADGTVKLMDFGIAKSASDHKLTMTGTTMGSLYYMSPEQITGVETLDARSDLYSVGVSLYELVTGKRPFDGDSQFAIMSAHLQKVPVPPITIDPTLPAELNELIMLSVNREAGQRFQTAEAFRNALSSVVASPVAAAAEPTIPVAPPMDAQAAVAQAAVAQAAPRSNRALWATLGALCFACVLVGAVLLWPSKKTTSAKTDTPATLPPVATAPAPTAPIETSPAPAPVQPSAPSPEPVQAAAPPVSTQPKQVANPVKPVVSKPSQSAAVQAPVQQPVQTPMQPAAPPPSAPAPVVAPPQAPQPDLSAQRAELQKARESYAGLNARAMSVHSTLQNLQRSQAASGLGLRGDWLQAASLMDSFFQGARDAINAGDGAAARDLMDKGERQLEKLEKALNK